MPGRKLIDPSLTESEIRALAPHHADVLTGMEGGASYEDIALTLNVPLGTVKSRVNRARAALAKLRAPAEHAEAA